MKNMIESKSISSMVSIHELPKRSVDQHNNYEINIAKETSTSP